MGVLLACGVYGASSLRSLQSRLPFVVSPPFMSLLSFTCSCGGMGWSQVCGPSCCSYVLDSCGVSVAPLCRLGLWLHPLLGFFLWRLFGLGLVGCGPAWVPAFFWRGTLLPLSWLFSLGDSFSVVVQAP